MCYQIIPYSVTTSIYTKVHMVKNEKQKNIPHCRNSYKTNRTIVERCKIQDSNVNVINSHVIRLCIGANGMLQQIHEWKVYN
jgi:hypothetical protein